MKKSPLLTSYFLKIVICIMLPIILLSCRNPGSYYCWDDIVSRGNDYVFVAKHDYDSRWQPLQHPSGQENRPLFPKMIQRGTRFKLHQVYVCRAYIVTSFLPSYIKKTLLEYKLERIRDGRIFHFDAHLTDSPINDKEIISPHGSRLVDFALNHEKFKQTFSPMNKSARRPIRIISKSGFSH